MSAARRCFFSSRRRHTRWPRDWSSDVCSSDLGLNLSVADKLVIARQLDEFGVGFIEGGWPGAIPKRSEERRVGKECRSGWGAAECEKKQETRVIDIVYQKCSGEVCSAAQVGST